MKLKDRNNVLQLAVEDSLRELSNVVSKQTQTTTLFSWWINSKFVDKDKNQCVRGVLDVALAGEDGKVKSFKLLLDRVLILRKNEGTIESPKYGKQLGYEELRRVMLLEVIGKGVSGLALGLAQKTKEGIEDFNKVVEQDEV